MTPSPNNYSAASISRSSRLAAIAGAVGTSIEWYDFFIYGTSAALVFPALFFPAISGSAGVLAALATFGAGFAARPLAGMVFGHFGDRIGRKPMLVFTLISMGTGTFLIGVLPTYSAIGVWAPILLVFLRIVQGVAIGGEWGGAVGLVSETSPQHRRGWLTSLVQVGSPVGLVLSTSVLLGIQQMPKAALLAWGWRIPFLASIILVAVGALVRLRVEESPLFTTVQETEAVARVPFGEVITTYPRNTILGILACSSVNVAGYVGVTYSLVYGKQNGLTSTQTLLALLIGSAAIMIAEPLYGALTDKVGPKPVFMFGACGLIVWAVPFFYLARLGNFGLFTLAVAVLLIFAHAPSYGSQARLYADLYGTRIRYSGVSVAYQFGGLLSSAPTPFLAAYLVDTYHGFGAVAAYLIFAGVVTIVTTAYLRPVLWESARVRAGAVTVADVTGN